MRNLSVAELLRFQNLLERYNQLAREAVDILRDLSDLPHDPFLVGPLSSSMWSEARDWSEAWREVNDGLDRIMMTALGFQEAPDA